MLSPLVATRYLRNSDKQGFPCVLPHRKKHFDVLRQKCRSTIAGVQSLLNLRDGGPPSISGIVNLRLALSSHQFPVKRGIVLPAVFLEGLGADARAPDAKHAFIDPLSDG